MNLVLSTVLLLGAAPAVPATSAIVIEESAVVRQSGRVVVAGTQRTEVAGSRLRRETSSDGRVLLLDADSPLPVVSFDEGSDTWFAFPAEAIRQQDLAGPMMEGVAVDETGEPIATAAPFRATGRTETIGDWKAAEWTAVQPGVAGQHVTLWLASRPNGVPDVLYADLLARIYSRPGSRWESYFVAMKKLSGFPVRMEIRHPARGGDVVVTTTVTRIFRATVSADRFDVPAGFTRVSDPLGSIRAPEKEITP